MILRVHNVEDNRGQGVLTQHDSHFLFPELSRIQGCFCRRRSFLLSYVVSLALSLLP